MKFCTLWQASPGWAIRFCKRHPELLQHIPTLDTTLPGPLLQKVQKFRSEVQQIIRDRGLVLGCVGNMDELYLSFSALASGGIIMVAKKHETDIIIMIVIIHICMQSCGKAIYTFFWYLFPFSSSVFPLSLFSFSFCYSFPSAIETECNQFFSFYFMRILLFLLHV